MHKLYTGVPWLWKIVNNVPFLQKAAMRYVYLSNFKILIFLKVLHRNVNKYFGIGRGASVDSPPLYNSGYDYVTTESHYNRSYYARSLPPVPQNCPTPMGVAGESIVSFIMKHHHPAIMISLYTNFFLRFR